MELVIYICKKAFSQDSKTLKVNQKSSKNHSLPSSKDTVKPNLEKDEKIKTYEKNYKKNPTNLQRFIIALYLRIYNLLSSLHTYLFYGISKNKIINKKILFIYENERYYLATWAAPIGLDWKKYTDSLNKEIVNLE
jgi:hypothetical protein